MPAPVATVLVGRVRTLDPARPRAEAIGWVGEHLVAVGSEAEVEAAVGPGHERIVLGERTILPGFIDAHHHVAVTALYGGSVRLEPPRVTDIASLLAALREEAAKLPPGRFVVASQWDEGRLRERRPPTREELDAAVPDRPAFLLHYTCHRALANTRALSLAGIDARTPDPVGGRISRTPSGAPDGLLIEQGMSRVEALARKERSRVDAEGVMSRMASHYEALARSGITRVCDAAVPAELLELLRELAARGGVTVPTHVCPISTSGWLQPPLDALEGPVSRHREGPLEIGPVKLVFDGAPSCAMCLSWGQTLASSAGAAWMSLRRRSLDPLRTALSIEPRLGRAVRTGIAMYRPEAARAIVGAAVARGFSLATHALGNDAIAIAIDAYEAVGAKLHGGGVARIEHAAFATPEQARRMADLGVAAVVQPAMLAMPSAAHAPTIPGLPFFPLARLLAAGVTLCGSSDYPVTTFDPLAAIRAATRRENLLGEVVDPEERIDLDAALAMYTRDAARVLGVGDETGTLAPNKRADVNVIEGLEGPDPRLMRTWVGGRAID